MERLTFWEERQLRRWPTLSPVSRRQVQKSCPTLPSRRAPLTSAAPSPRRAAQVLTARWASPILIPSPSPCKPPVRILHPLSTPPPLLRIDPITPPLSSLAPTAPQLTSRLTSRSLQHQRPPVLESPFRRLVRLAFAPSPRQQRTRPLRSSMSRLTDRVPTRERLHRQRRKSIARRF
jgi:hypothetical protein